MNRSPLQARGRTDGLTAHGTGCPPCPHAIPVPQGVASATTRMAGAWITARAGAAGLLLALAGCAQLPAIDLDPQGALQAAQAALAPAPPPLALPPAPRPAVRVGDTLFLGRHLEWQLQSVQAGALQWQVQVTGADAQPPVRIVTRRDFFAPWQERPDPGGIVRSTLRGDDPATLWPLQTGRRVAFEEVRTVHPPAGSPSGKASDPIVWRWECAVQDARTRTVPAGTFAVFPVRCDAWRAPFPLPQQTIHWDYAPGLGQFVRRQWNEGTTPREWVLAAALPGPLATPTRRAAVRARLLAAP